MGLNLSAQLQPDQPYVRAVYDFTNIFVSRVIKPWLQNKWVFMLTAAGRTHRQALKVLHDVSNKVVRDRRAAAVRHPYCLHR